MFVGPSWLRFEKMGSKIESKRIAEGGRRPGRAGYHGGAQDLNSPDAGRRTIGFPVLIKASAGGGRTRHAARRPRERVRGRPGRRQGRGAGPRSCDDAVPAREIHPEPAASRSAARRRSGRRPWCICSSATARSSANNQKVLEEAPAPTLPDAVRSKLYSTPPSASAAPSATIRWARSNSSWIREATVPTSSK